ncbi:MAG: hypothetical protein AAFO95_13065 [Cyanobacteria bacterium J06600_6]
MKAALRLSKWQIVKYAAIFIATVFTFILLVNGVDEASFRIAIRFTARSSCILFLLAFCASPLRRLAPSSISNWLIQNRRYFGLSMAISHGFHALAIIGVAVSTSENMIRDNHLATLGYVFIILMSITSFERSAAVLGKRLWRILHTVGMYYLWLSFVTGFSERLTESWFIYSPFVITLILAFLLRFIPSKKPKFRL